eukprot:Seg165.6 transcript_id=Seg165.6/GoldUCD/mRNA.D3Y31 product="hypothetical protein" protein_id=Seg165.6/GoldUCD/D3Y31
MNRKAKFEFYRSIEPRSIDNEKKFWKAVKPMFSNGNPMGEKIILIEDEVIISDDTMIAECFNSHFVNITDSLGLDHMFKQASGCIELDEKVEAALIKYTFDELEQSESRMAKYWLSFLQMVEILMQNIHAQRSRNWEEFKISLRSLFALQMYNNNKYGRWPVEFWLEMSCLPEEKAQYLYQGLFAQSMTGKPYSCLPLDLWIEMTMNKGSKMKAGWKKILKNEQMLLIHAHNANSVNRVRVALHAMANVRKATQDHRENSTFRLQADKQAVQDIDKRLTEFNSKPFDLSNDTLRTLQSGMIASDKLVHDFITAHDDGELTEKAFDDKMQVHLRQATFNRERERFNHSKDYWNGKQSYGPNYSLVTKQWSEN